MLDIIEKNKKENIIFFYTNIIESDAMIEPSQVKKISEIINSIDNKYDTLNFVINTNGGNLATGHKIASLLRNKFKTINYIVLERCSSTGTFIALSGDKLIISEEAIITPTEPQMNTNTENNISISTSLIKSYLDNINKDNNYVEKISALTYANYQNTISYFKDLCYNTFSRNKVDLIIDFMLNKVHSHQYPITINDLKRMDIDVSIIDKDLYYVLNSIHNQIIKYLNEKMKTNKRLVLLLSSNKCFVYEKEYDNSKRKIFEGFKGIKEDEIMKKIESNQENVKRNGRVEEILDDIEKEKLFTKDAYNDEHWDSYWDTSDGDDYDDSYSDGTYNLNIYKDAYTDYWDTYVDDAYYDYYSDSSNISNTYKDAYSDIEVNNKQKVFVKNKKKEN